MSNYLSVDQSSVSDPATVDPATGIPLEDVELVLPEFMPGQFRSSPWNGRAFLLTRDDASTDGYERWSVLLQDTNTIATREVSTWVLCPPVDTQDNDFLVSGFRALNQRRLDAVVYSGTIVDALDRFKSKVRDVAIEAHEDGNFCLDGMNEAFRALGLEEHNATHEVLVTFTVSATVRAADRDDAVEMLESWVSDIDTDSLDSDIESIDISSSRY